MSIAQDLRVAARRWWLVRGTPRPSEVGDAERKEFRRAFQQWISAPGDAVREVRLYEIDAKTVPWIDTGLVLDDGEWVTTVGAGRVVLSDPLDLWVGPQYQLWARVGEGGEVFNGTRETNSFCATGGGKLYLAGYFPGEWGDRHGALSTSPKEYRKYSGGLTIAVIRWKGSAAAGLASAGASPVSSWLDAERSRLASPVPVPRGWEHLWFIGNSEIFRDHEEDGERCIACHTENNVSILQHDAPFDLVFGTRLRWSWKVDQLPSLLPENTALTHDYLSIAVEFDNGRDITYTWSRELPEGTGYWCPLPTWKNKEFHVVVRNGIFGLGKWLEEERDLWTDYRQYIGEPPKRVVRVWLIAVSLFQKKPGRAQFRRIRLDEGNRTLDIG